ncbi:XdhC family protein [Aeromicrobium sp. REDSEA-S38_B2]|uniref:XdhC family protein n=1 Tax=Aeromicrobium sp. REDSEA-S38_B2 TaxID=1811528 RepID=UPI000AC140B9|nr:XdhC family protein [Aeromicrobium sp. REDSEA-S38_B2]
MTVADAALASAARWVQDSPVALATVVGTSGSAPRQAGAAMVVATDGRIAGSVSGGCVEAAVVDLAEATLASGEPTLRTFGFAADDLFDVGLTCGGRIEVLIQRVGPDDGLADVAARVATGGAVAVVTVLEHPDRRRVGERLVLTDGLGRSVLGEVAATVAAMESAFAAYSLGRGREIEEFTSALQSLSPLAAGNAPLVDGTVLVEATGLEPGPRMGHLKGLLHRIQVERDLSTAAEVLSVLDELDWRNSDHNDWPALAWP